MYKILQSTNSEIQIYLVSGQEIDKSVAELATVSLPKVPEMMKLHQVVITSPNTYSCRSLSCLCTHGELCGCFSPKTVTIPVEARVDVQTGFPHDCNDDTLIDKYVVVTYDGHPYPGIITDEDNDEVKVKCMHPLGPNRFFWPPRDDICWYYKDDVIDIIPEPKKVTERHMQIDPPIWNVIREKLDIPD